MTEHEKLKRICDEIGCGILFNYTSIDIDNNYRLISGNYFVNDNYLHYGDKMSKIIDVREIIFTPEFWDKLNYYLMHKKNYSMPYSGIEIFNHLHDPVTYLYNLLFNE